ncbi:MAG: zinc ABC transporter substrate-binding protein [Bacteroidota bacterium]
MKIFLSFLLSLTFITISLAQNDKPYKVIATASIFADMAKNIATDRIEIETIVPIGGDPHMHEPTPRDAQLVIDADLILKNGLTFEGWLNELIDNSGTSAKSILITAGVEAISSEQYAGSSDPHAWMSAENGLIYIENIKNALIQLDPEGREEYEFNYGVYKQQLEDLDAYIRTRVNDIPEEKRVLITSHDAFQYYGRRYGIRLESVLGVSTDADVQTADIVRLSEVIKSTSVPAVFIESTVNPKLLAQLAKDNNVKVGGKLFADSIGDEDSEAPSYYDMLKYNTDTVVEALTSKVEETQAAPEEEKSRAWIYILLAVAALSVLLILPRLMKT